MSDLVRLLRICAALITSFCLAANLRAQDSSILVERPKAPAIWRPYLAPIAPPVRLTSPRRLSDLIRDGKISLTLQDALALAIENNLDLEVDRYGPLLGQWQLQRAQGGGPLRGVQSGSSSIGQVASGQGITGSQAAAGLSGNTGQLGNGPAGGASVAQIGPITTNLDPVFQNTSSFSHLTVPQVNPVQSLVRSLVQTTHIYNSSIQQGFLTGGFLTLFDNESYLQENAPTDSLNPSASHRDRLYLQHNLLSGFGTAVNRRFIRVAEKNAGASQLTLKAQLANVVVNVINAYWDLVSDRDDVKSKQDARDLAQKFFEDTRNEISIGVLAKVDIFRAQAEAASRQRELILAQAVVSQQETLLKNLLSRDGIADPAVDTAEVIPIDKIVVPANEEDLPSLRELLATALAKRPDLAVTRLNAESAEISALGTNSGRLPTLVGFASTYNRGLAGTVVPGQGAPASLSGGLGRAFEQVVDRDFSSSFGGVFFQAPFRNQINQGDLGVEQLQLVQSHLTNRRDSNQLVVDISNQMVALRQARARYTTAVGTRELQERLLSNERLNFAIGTSTVNAVVGALRGLATARSAEIAASSTYMHARIAIDQIAGETLEKNNISIDDAGRIAGPQTASSKAQAK